MFKISRSKKILGDFTLLEVIDGLAEARFTGNDYFWTDGMDDWRKLNDFAEFIKNDKPPEDSNGAVTKLKSDPPPHKISSNDAESMPEPRCPACGSRSIQSFKMIYASGTRNFESIGFSSRGRAYYRTGHSASLLTSAAAPPSQSNSSGFLWFLAAVMAGGAIFAFTIPGFGWVMSIIAIAVAVYLARMAINENVKEDADYKEAMSEWDKEWLCKKCGTTFTVTVKDE